MLKYIKRALALAMIAPIFVFFAILHLAYAAILFTFLGLWMPRAVFQWLWNDKDIGWFDDAKVLISEDLLQEGPLGYFREKFLG